MADETKGKHGSFEFEPSISDSLFINSNSTQYGYGSLGIFHTPPLPGREFTASPKSLNQDIDFMINHPTRSSSPNPHACELLPIPKRERVNIVHSKICMLPTELSTLTTPQRSVISAISASTQKDSPSYSNTDYYLRSKHLKRNEMGIQENQIYQYYHPYFHKNHVPIYNEKGLDSIGQIQIKQKSKSPFFGVTHHRIASYPKLAGAITDNQLDSISKYPNLLLTIYILNASIGLAFLSEPYAIAHAGWTGIVGFIMVCLISYHCCSVYVKIQNKMHTESFRHPSYPQLAWIISGTWAYYLILVYSVLECMGVAAVYVVFLWNNVYYLLCRLQLYGKYGFVHSNVYFDDGKIWSTLFMSEIDQIVIVCVSIAAILPSILILKVSKLYWLSYGILIGSMIMAFTLLVFIILHVIRGQTLAHDSFEKFVPYGWQVWITNFSGFSISIGIFLFCFTSNAFAKLPLNQYQSTTNNHAHRSVFDRVLSRSFFLLFFMYVSIGIFGYLLYGKSCHSMILRNIMHHCKNIGIFCDLVCIFFVIVTWSAIFPLIIRISEFIESNVIYEYLRNRQQRRKTSDFALEQTNYSIRSVAKYLQKKNGVKAGVESVSTSSMEAPKPTDGVRYISSDDSTNYEEGNESGGSNVHITNGMKRICRSVVFVFVLFISWMFRNHLTFLESIVGICFSTVTCMIFPCYLYLAFLWNTLSGWTKLTHILLIIFVVIAAIALLIGAVVDFVERQDVSNHL